MIQLLLINLFIYSHPNGPGFLEIGYTHVSQCAWIFEMVSICLSFEWKQTGNQFFLTLPPIYLFFNLRKYVILVRNLKNAFSILFPSEYIKIIKVTVCSNNFYCTLNTKRRVEVANICLWRIWYANIKGFSSWNIVFLQWVSVTGK